MPARPKKHSRTHGRADPRQRSLLTRIPHWIPESLACAMGLVLVLPCLRFTWLWDDFDFLQRAQVFRPSFLLPDPSVVFYRPLSREVFLTAIWFLGRKSPMVAHVAAAALFAGAIWLLVAITTRLAGRRAGVMAGLAFASLGSVPLLVGWASGVQDLLAVVFVLLGILLALEGHTLWSVGALAAALLSKETALALVPVAAMMPWILGRRPARPLWHLIPYLLLLSAWLAVHPAPEILSRHTAALASDRYVGIAPPGRASFLASTLLSMLNIPPPGVPASPLVGRLNVGLVAVALALCAFWMVSGRRAPSGPTPDSPNARGVVLLGILLATSPLLLTVAVVRLWTPYYAVFPALGTSLLIGYGLARLPSRLAALSPIASIAFLAMGLWARGMAPDPSVTCERNLEATSGALHRVEEGFKTLYPSFPSHTTALVSVAGTGNLGVYTTMHRFQALRIWYADPTIMTLLPERRRPQDSNELLFRITSALDVVEIDPDHCQYRSSGETPPRGEVQRPTRTYARAVAATGDPLRAFHIQEQIARLDRGVLMAYDLRLAAMYLFAAGQDEQASRMLDTIPAFPRDRSLDMVTKLYEDATRGLAVERFAFRVFSTEENDLEANRYVMRRLRREGYLESAAYFARRVQRLVPGDTESDEVTRAAKNAPVRQEITVPMGIDSL